jgi:4-hydroxy-4-methyl-2-oxoglutarate aldolase
VPQPVVKQALTQALEKVEGEDRTRVELEQGASLADVFAKYGIL